MGEQTGISWCHHTWSPWYGCTQVSMGEHGACVGCYARQLSEIRMHRVVFGGPGRGVGTRDVRADSAWAEPIRWNRTTPGALVFPSMCDPFDNHPDLAEPRRRFFDLIRQTPNLTWLLLTKRPGNIEKLFGSAAGNYVTEDDELIRREWPRNAAIGCTVVTQEEADRDIPHLLAAKAALKPAFAFLSMEPMLGPVDLTAIRGKYGDRHETMDALRGTATGWPGSSGFGGRAGMGGWPRLDWIITGGETDQGSHRARLTHPDWLRAIRDQCAAAGVPYHHKQNGEWWPICWMDDGVSDTFYHPAPRRDPEAIRRCKVEHTVMNLDGSLHPGAADPETYHAHHGSMLMFKAGKKRSGRLIDGVLHDAMPEARP